MRNGRGPSSVEVACRVGIWFLVGGLLVVGIGAGCGASQQRELPPPDSGHFLTIEEQQALGSQQLEEYCRMLGDYLVVLKEDIQLSRALDDSLSVVLESMNAEHSELNNESRRIENQLRRLKTQQKGITHYVVRQGDTLMSLSALFYGAAQEWRKLYNENKDVIDDPGAPLKPGTRLIIPR